MALDDKSGSVWSVAIVFAILTWVTVALRIYVRVEQLGKFGVDDKLVVLAQIFFTAYLACQLGGAAYGTGRHIADVGRDNAETALKFWFFCEVWYSLASTSVKLAICLSLRRVTVKKVHILIVYALIVWSIALGLAFFLGIVFQCMPTSDWWDLDPLHKHCLSPHTITSLTYTVSALNVACDWTLGIFPFFIVKDLTIPTYQKILVASILAFGALGSTATIVRMVYIPTLEQTYAGWDGEFLYDTVPVAVWTTVEVGVGITAICLSTLRPLINRLLCILRPATYGTYGNTYPSTLHSNDSRNPIPLVDSHFSDGPRDEFAGVTHFNATRPIGGRYGRQEQYNASSQAASQKSVTMINTTKPLSSSDMEEDYYHERSLSSRQYGPS